MSLWSCTTCSKSFSRKGDLTRHKAIHAGIKPHVCETCGKGFAQFSGLKTHRNVHSKAKPYTCGIGTCTKAFGDPSSRTRHRKETHRCEGAFKCTITDCGTRIKRRSAFMAHLRKHGLDPRSLDLDAIVLKSSSARGIPAPAFTSPDAENKSHHKTKPAPFFGDNSRYYILSDGSDTSHLVDNNGWSGDHNPFDCRRSDWFLANDTLLLGPMLDQTVNSGLSDLPHDVYYPLLAASPDFPALEPFLEAGNDELQSSPSSTYSDLCTTHLNDDVVSLSLGNNVSQEPLQYNLIM